MKFLRKILIFFFGIIDQFFHQKRILQFLKSKKLEIKNFIDVGAFEGKYTDLIFLINRKCQVIMFEPQKKYYEFLKKKYINNSEIEIMRAGLSNEKKVKNLKINRHEITSTFSEFKKTNRYLNLKAILFESKLENMTYSEEKVEVITLDEFLNERKINKIDLIKIDTEGHEYEVLEGIKNSIKKINYILIEFHIDEIYENYNQNKIHEKLIENNFKLLKKFKFPFTTWQDCLYINLNFKN